MGVSHGIVNRLKFDTTIFIVLFVTISCYIARRFIKSLILLYICAPTWIYAYICISMHLYVCIRVCAMTYMLHEVRIFFRTRNSVHII